MVSRQPQRWLGNANQTLTMKPLLIAMAASVAATPAFAGPYAKTKSEFFGQGDTYHRSVQQVRVGYETQVGDWSPYAEVGGGVVTPDSEDTLGLFAFQVGTTVQISEKLSGYALIENLHFDEKNHWEGVIGTKYTF